MDIFIRFDLPLASYAFHVSEIAAIRTLESAVQVILKNGESVMMYPAEGVELTEEEIKKAVDDLFQDIWETLNLVSIGE